MKAFQGWMGSSKSNQGSASFLSAENEQQALEDALKSAALIMNDEIQRAEAELIDGTSPFHKLGYATAFFLRSVIGFEQDVMRVASEKLFEAEKVANEHQSRALRDPTTAHQSKIYPPGSEYALCHAQAQLMSAVVGVLNESLTESLKGFYKLRKAFVTLRQIVQAEENYLAARSLLPEITLANTEAKGPSAVTPSENQEEEDDDDDDFQEAADDLSDQSIPDSYQGHTGLPSLSKLNLENGKSREPPSDPSVESQRSDFRTVTSDPIDLHIHGGTALCFGLLQLILSMIPPALSKLLSILSFRGDRQHGLQLLWEATTFKTNINGAMAGLIVLGFHSGAVALCDIHRKEAFPQARLNALLRELRSIYPASAMWAIEEARLAKAECDLERAAEIARTTSTKSSFKQVEAVRVFELSLALMFQHRYEECAESFVKCVDLNSWSHSLYYYAAACSYIELYRTAGDSDKVNASLLYREKSKEMLEKVRTSATKKRIMGRPLPFNTFINRKLSKWKERAKSRDCDLIDAVGVSPLEELIYFWSGYIRMGPSYLETSLQRLTWSQNEKINAQWESEPADERAVLGVLKATCLRRLNKPDEARAVLSAEVFCYEPSQIKTCNNADNWPLPVAHYENAVCYWQEAGGQDGHRAKLELCSEEISKVEKWEGYDLDTRVGMKVTTARETLKQLGIN